ncbi:hypothetical protein ACFYSC_25595 [Streptosporangium sp. NPDC004379]|uniref:hypothetical protein n=1 Tax=Streptosporangium sp. NPDC004379 TaxID=3366189 RepID=UPI0036CA3B19
MPTMESVLSDLAEDRVTGALRLDEAGTVYLTDGRVTYAETPAVPRLEELLTAGDRIPAQAVRQARQAATEDRPGGERLVGQGVLTRGELEFCVLSAVLDAAYFLSGAAAHRKGFRSGDRHWLGPQWYFDVAGLSRECERRRAQLDRAWPSGELDTLPVVPLARIPAQRVVLTSLQWEVLVAADSAATPAELARRLGRPAYSVLLAVRRLAAAGLLRVPEPGERPGVAPVSGTGAPASRIPQAPSPPQTPRASQAPSLPQKPQTPSAPPALPRRPKTTGEPRAGGEPRDGAAGGTASARWLPAATGDPADVNLLIRLRNALEALT